MGILRDSKTEPSPWRGDICGQGGGLSPSSRSSGSNQVPMAWAVTMMGGGHPQISGPAGIGTAGCGDPHPGEGRPTRSCPPKKNQGQAAQPGLAPHAARCPQREPVPPYHSHLH